MARLKRHLLYGLTAQCIVMQPALASPKPSPFLILGGSAEAPRGYLAMCAQTPVECDGAPAASSLAASADSVDVHTPVGASIGATGAIVAARDVLPVLAPAIAFRPSRFSVAVHGPMLNDRFGGFTLTIGSPTPPQALAFVYRVDSTPILAPMPHPTPAPAPAPMSPDIDEQQLLRQINVRVNRIVRQATDLAIYGREEVWHASGAYDGAAGDCEDMALEKQAELITAGFPKSRLSLAVVYAPAVGLHTVLVARTRDGDQVLDSRTPYLRPWYKSGYTWLSVQAFAGSKAWRQPLSERQIALAANDTADADRS